MAKFFTKSLEARQFLFASFVSIALYIYGLVFLSYSDGNIYLTKLSGLIVVLCVLCNVFVGEVKFYYYRKMNVLFIWTVFVVFSGLFAINIETSLLKIITFGQVFLFSIFFVALVVQFDRIEIVLFLFVSAVVFSCFYSIGSSSYYTVDGRFYGTMQNSNILAFVSLIAFITSVYFTIKSQLIWKVICIFSAVFLFYIIVLTGSRKAIIGLFLISFVFFVSFMKLTVGRNGYKKIVGLVFLLLLLVVVSGNYIVNSEHFDRIDRLYYMLSSGGDESVGESEVGRLMFYKIGFKTFLENPLLGIGLDNFRYIEVGFFSKTVGTYSHSNYVELLAGTGLIGFVLYYSFFYFLARDLFSSLKRSKLEKNSRSYILALYMSFFSCMVIYDFAMVSYYEKVSWLVVSIIISGGISLKSSIYRSNKD